MHRPQQAGAERDADRGWSHVPPKTQPSLLTREHRTPRRMYQGHCCWLCIPKRRCDAPGVWPEMGERHEVIGIKSRGRRDGRRRLGDLLLGGRHPVGRLLPGGTAEPRPRRSARDRQVDPGGVRRKLHRLLPRARGARPAVRHGSPRVRPRYRRRAEPARQHPLHRAQRRDRAGRCPVAAARCDRHVRHRGGPPLRVHAPLVLFAFWWLTLEPPLSHRRAARVRWWAWLKPDDPDRSANRAQVVSWAALLTVGLSLAMLAAPPLISWLTRSTGSFGTVARAIGFGTRPTWSAAAVTGLVAAVAAIAKYCQAGLAKWNALSRQANSAAAGQPGFLTMLAGSLRQRLLPWLASAVIVLGGAVLALLWISDGTRSGFTAAQFLQVIAALAVMVFGRAAVNVNRMSLHDVYRWRLANAFAVTRRAAQERNPVSARRLFAEAAATRLSELGDGAGGAADEPGLVI